MVISRNLARNSIKTRITLATITIFVISIWVLAIYASRTLREDMVRMLGNQQFSTVSMMAAEANREIGDRMLWLESVAKQISPAMLGDSAALQNFLAQRLILPSLFNGGGIIYRLDGTAVADSLPATGRIGINYMDVDTVATALKEGKSNVGKPLMGKKLGAPVFGMTVPIRDAQGKVIGAFAGVTNLGMANFLDKIQQSQYGKTGGYLLVAPKHRLIVTATDKKRVMETLPAAGVSPQLDRFIDGYDGSEVFVNPLGEEVLASAKGIPAAGWYVAATLPTAEAFAPIHDMQQRMLVAAILLTLLAGTLTWWMLRRQLAPMLSTVERLARLAESERPTQPLPVASNDEIGNLISGFNSLLESLGQRDANLRDSYEAHRSTLETALDGYCYVDAKGKLLDVNPAYCQLSGYTREELLGMSIFDLEAKESAAETAAHIQAVIKRGSDRFQSRHRRKDGSIWEAEVSATYRGHAGGRFFVFLRDITERKRGEAALRESEARLRDITFSVGDWIWEVDEHCAYTYSSQRGFDLFGPAPASIIGKTPFDLMPPDEAKRVAAIFAESAANKAPIRDLENWNIRADGELVCLLTNGVPILDDAGNLKGYRGVDRDITERKRLEKERKVLEAQYLQAQKMDSVGRLAGGVAHDFNNMLTVIRGNAALALEKVDAEHPLRADLIEIRKAADRSAALTRQLLAFARKQIVEPKVLNLNDNVVGIIKMLQRLIGEDIDLKWSPAADLWPVKVDPSQIDQILANLCINARDAIAGVGNIVIETGNSSLDEGYCATHAGFVPGDYVRISVSDNGRGIDKEALPNIFEPFFTTKEIGEGTGLGLATVYGAVKQNNGFINVYSEPDKGTTFTIYFPRHAGGPEERQERGAAGQTVRGNETVLLVEDEPAILKLTERILSRAGYAVLSARTPGEAMRLAREHASPIDLLITDVVMPEMNGRDLARSLLSVYPGLKLLFMSGYTANIIVHQGVLDQGVNFIEKPFSVENLTAKVREVLDSN